MQLLVKRHRVTWILSQPIQLRIWEAGYTLDTSPACGRARHVVKASRLGVPESTLLPKKWQQPEEEEEVDAITTWTWSVSTSESFIPIVVTMEAAKMAELPQSHGLRSLSPEIATPCPAASDTTFRKLTQSISPRKKTNLILLLLLYFFICNRITGNIYNSLFFLKS